VPLADLMATMMDMMLSRQWMMVATARDTVSLPAIVARFVARALSNQRRLRARTGGDTRNQCGVVGGCITMYGHSGLGIHLPFIGSSRAYQL
jgi:hypothetical protein